jgi:nucleotide-binding universal stress UspA family protein
VKGLSMQRILAATDFSTRSDRALRRATLLAREHGASLAVLHVVDDDRPEPLRDAEVATTTGLLRNLAETISRVDGVDCAPSVAQGDTFSAILESADALNADLIVIGPHRRRARDVFAGTTAERTVRRGTRPVLVVNGAPLKPYARILLAVDFSAHSTAAIKAVDSLRLAAAPEYIALHIFESPPGQSVLGGNTERDNAEMVERERRRATQALDEFFSSLGVKTLRRIAQIQDAPVAQLILERARLHDADLIVLGAHGKSGVRRLLLGSVADAVLRDSEIDVLAIPAGPL